MSETATRATGALYPIVIATAPRAARALFKRLSSLPTWLAEGWAHPSDAFLRDEGEYSDKRPIQRARKVLVDLGVIEYRKVRRGELLPNGKRVAFAHWIYLHGPALRPGGGGGGETAPVPTEHQNGAASVLEPLRVGANLAHRSVDPDPSNKVRLSAAPEASPPPPESERTLFHSKGDPREGVPEVSTRTLAHRVASYWVEASGLRWPTIKDSIIEHIAPFLERMNGDASLKVERACRVVDHAIRESKGPAKLGFVFHPQIYWKRLADIDSASPKTFARAPRRPVDAPARPKRDEASPKPRPVPEATPERVDAETMRRFLASFDAATSAAPTMVAPSAPPAAPATSSPLPPPATPAGDLGALSRSVGRWVEPPACHDPTCGECERCEKHAPLTRKLFRDVREAARGPKGAQTFLDEVNELRDRDYAARRADQLRRLMEDASELEELEPPARPVHRLPLASTDEREELRLALEEFHALDHGASSERAA